MWRNFNQINSLVISDISQASGAPLIKEIAAIQFLERKNLLGARGTICRPKFKQRACELHLHYPF